MTTGGNSTLGTSLTSPTQDASAEVRNVRRRTGVRVANGVKSIASVYVEPLSVIILLITSTAGLVECTVSVPRALRGA